MAENKYKMYDMVWLTDPEGRERYVEVTSVPGDLDGTGYYLNTMNAFGFTTRAEEHEIHALSLRERINRIEERLGLA